MIQLTTENTAKAIERCKSLRPKVRFVEDRTFAVHSANNGNTYTVRFSVKEGKRFGVCECKAAHQGLICYHLAAGAAVNIYRQTLKRAVETSAIN